MPQTTQQLARHAEYLCQTQSLAQLASILDLPKWHIEKLAENPHYHTFELPKKDGSFRLIEDPEESLKDFLQRLNYQLQIVYAFNKTRAAYGFVRSLPDETEPRNILNNAKRHLNKTWMLNADFEDFFHDVSTTHIRNVFSNPPFEFNDEAVELLTKLTSYKERLPMGSPTSPVLSNFATRGLDHDLTEMADNKQWVYTRFADDLTFSAMTGFSTDDVKEIRALSTVHGFKFNEEKLKIRSPNAEKQVTGIVLKAGKVELPDDYLPALEKEIESLRIILEAKYRTGEKESSWVKKFKQHIEGMLRFVALVLGEDSAHFRYYKLLFNQAQMPPESFGAMSWLAFGYENLI